jgi:hypothetical protein
MFFQIRFCEFSPGTDARIVDENIHGERSGVERRHEPGDGVGLREIHGLDDDADRVAL